MENTPWPPTHDLVANIFQEVPPNGSKGEGVKSGLSGLQRAGKLGADSCQRDPGWCHKQGQEANRYKHQEFSDIRFPTSSQKFSSVLLASPAPFSGYGPKKRQIKRERGSEKKRDREREAGRERNKEKRERERKAGEREKEESNRLEYLWGLLHGAHRIESSIVPV